MKEVGEGGRKGEKHTSGVISKEELIDEDPEYGGRNIGECGKGGVISTTSFPSPDGDGGQTTGNVTSRIGGNCEMQEDCTDRLEGLEGWGRNTYDQQVHIPKSRHR